MAAHQVFSLELTHEYAPEDASGILRLSATDETRRQIDRAGLLMRALDGAKVALFARGPEQRRPWANNAVLGFWIEGVDPVAWAVTQDAVPERWTYYFAERGGDVAQQPGDWRLLTGADPLAFLAPEDRFVLHRVATHEAVSTLVTRHDAARYLADAPDGAYSVVGSEQDAKILTGARTRTVLGLIEICVGPLAVDEPLNQRVHLAARKCHWRYIVHGASVIEVAVLRHGRTAGFSEQIDGRTKILSAPTSMPLAARPEPGDAFSLAITAPTGEPQQITLPFPSASEIRIGPDGAAVVEIHVFL